jgi:long-chain acyl-CoA synthetase
MNRFPVRPHKDVHVLTDLVRSEMDTPRTLWNTKITNATLQDRVASFGTGILRLAGLQSQESNVLLLLNDCIEFLIADLALSSHSIPSMTLTAPNLLSPILDTHPPSAIITHAEFLPTLLELIYDAGEEGRHHTIVVVGEPSSNVMASVASKVRVLVWTDVEREGIKNSKTMSPLPKPSDVFSVSFFQDSNGHIQGTQLTHANLTAGVAAVHALFPMSAMLSTLDTIVSTHSMGGAYGRAVAYTAIYEGASFATTESSKLFRVDEAIMKQDINDILSAQLYSIPSATVLFLRPSHLELLADAILREAKKSLIISSFAWRHKLAGISEGFVSKDSLWDRLVYDAARARVVGEGAGTFRMIIAGEGSLPASVLTPARVALSCPVICTLTHPTVAGPVLASNALDLQDFPVEANSFATVGPPTVSIEAKLTGLDDTAVEGGSDPIGLLTVRGPPVTKLLSGEDLVSASGYINVRAGESVLTVNGEDEDGWTNLNVKIRVHTNGTFRVVV